MLRILVVVLLALLAEPAAAQFMGPGSRHVVPTLTVAEATAARPGTRVALEGYIVERYRGDYYRFRDSTGETLVAIESHIWRRQPIEPDTRVRIAGEVERNLFRRYIEVIRLDLVR